MRSCGWHYVLQNYWTFFPPWNADIVSSSSFQHMPLDLMFVALGDCASVVSAGLAQLRASGNRLQEASTDGCDRLCKRGAEMPRERMSSRPLHPVALVFKIFQLFATE